MAASKNSATARRRRSRELPRAKTQGKSLSQKGAKQGGSRGEKVVTVRELLYSTELLNLEFSVLCGEKHLDSRITHPRVQKPGLAFAGYFPYIKPGRVQIVGESELAYLDTLDPEDRRQRFEHITELPVPVFVVTKGLRPHRQLLDLCETKGVPMLSSPALSSVVIEQVSFFLEDNLVPSVKLHGVLLDIYGLGVLLIGDSGVGKSECALDLVTRGHSLVADDQVTIKRYPKGELIGYCEEPLRHHMELRGLGIINVQDLFGLAAVRERKTIDLVVKLEHLLPGSHCERLGLDEALYDILDVPCPHIQMPVAVGRNLSILIEIAARNHVLKLQGHHSARELVRKLEEQLEHQRVPLTPRGKS